MDVSLGANAALVATVGALAIGLVFGVVAERSGLCTMGAVADVVLFGGWRRARIWGAAIVAAAIPLQLWAMIGGLELAATTAWSADGWWRAPTGGMVFGVGMVIAGGCLSRAWIRLASGSVKGLVVVSAALPGLVVVPPPLGSPAGAAMPSSLLLGAIGLAAAGLIAVWVGRDARFRQWGGPLSVAMAVGGLVALAHVATAPTGPDGVRFVVPLAAALRGDATAFPGLAVIAGTVLGAALSAIRAGRFRRERWTDRGDVIRHVLGGLAMGVGGGLALGCTVGAGITGTAAMAPSAWLALAGMVAGAALALKVMLAGGPAGALHRVRSTIAGSP